MERHVSVVLPVKDDSQTLTTAAHSVLAQQGVQVDLLIVDDGSIDDLAPVLSGLARPNVRVIRNASPQGVARARNQGIDAATGDYVAFIDADDAWLPLKLSRQVEALEGAGGPALPQLSVCSFLIQHASGAVGGLGGPLVASPTSADLLSARTGEWVTSTFVATRAAILAGVRFDPGLVALEDQDFALQVCDLPGSVQVVADPLVVKRQAGSQNLSNPAALAQGHLQYAAKHASHPEWSHRYHQAHHLDAVHCMLQAGDEDGAHEAARASTWPIRSLSGAKRPLKLGVRVLRHQSGFAIRKLLRRLQSRAL